MLVCLFGYLVAVAAAVVVTVLLVVAGGALVAGPEPLPGMAATLALGLWAGGIMTLPSALPGFVAAVLLARILEAERCRWFVVAGGIDALVAVGLFSLWDGRLSMPPGTVAACVAGGLAGGFAYWKAAGRFLAEWARPEVA